MIRVPVLAPFSFFVEYLLHMLKVLIVNYNTQDLTDCTIRSVNKHTPDCKIYVFDNSDKSPFINTHKNVEVIDNTKSQYINFDEFLSRYPNRHKSPGNVHHTYISPKHCWTVDRCMDIIDDNFVLLDSDVIVKKDLNGLVDDECIFVGDVMEQPLTRGIKRLLPFVCYINVRMCKEKGVRYFDDNYMHGLYNIQNNPDSDKYDTGGGFYINAKKYKHKLINHKDYVIHYKGGSWNDVASRLAYKNGTPQEFINKYRIYWDNSYKKVIYTCICGNYDRLKTPAHIDDDCDYVCFTDQHFDTNVWNIRQIPQELDGLSDVKKQRAIKVLAHKYLSEYDTSVWVDANIDINGSVSDYIKNVDEPGKYLIVGEHPNRDCIYDEEKAVITHKKDTLENTQPQINKYKDEGFPEHYGLPQTCILIRHHNDPKCIEFDELWWKQIEQYSHRDQLSFSYVMWKVGKEGIKYAVEGMTKTKLIGFNLR